MVIMTATSKDAMKFLEIYMLKIALSELHSNSSILISVAHVEMVEILHTRHNNDLQFPTKKAK